MDNNTSVQNIVGANLRKYRLMAKLTQDELAEKAGLSASFVASIERGTKGVTLKSLEQLSNALNISIEMLLHTSDTNNIFKNLEILLKGKPEPITLIAEEMIHLFVSALEIYKDDT